MRTTKKDLFRSIKWINGYLKENGKDIQYDLECAYGGYCLIKFTNENGGCANRSYRVSAGEMYRILVTLEYTLIDVLENDLNKGV